MGKQAKQKGSHFGGEWTIQKLHIIEEYLKAYSTVLKNLKVKKIYVDGLPIELKNYSLENEYGITLISLDESFRQKYEPGTSKYNERISALKALHEAGCYT